MNVPADNEHLQRFFMVLQSNAAAQNLQANIMAATLQSQATQIINNQILANQKAHHLHQVKQNRLKKKKRKYFQMLQQSQSMRQSPPQKRIPRRVESRPEETPIMPMGCSQQARKVWIMKKELCSWSFSASAPSHQHPPISIRSKSYSDDEQRHAT